MTLPESIRKAIELTLELHRAIAAGNLEACQSLLSARGDAMTDFEQRHGQASAEDQSACHPILVELYQADQQLQATAEAAQLDVARQFRENMGAGTGSSVYDNNSNQGCVDKKA